MFEAVSQEQREVSVTSSRSPCVLPHDPFGERVALESIGDYVRQLVDVPVGRGFASGFLLHARELSSGLFPKWIARVRRIGALSAETAPSSATAGEMPSALVSLIPSGEAVRCSTLNPLGVAPMADHHSIAECIDDWMASEDE
jgi:hypothetical protein